MIRPTELRSRRGIAAAVVVLAACGGTIDSRQNPAKGSAPSGASSGEAGGAQPASGMGSNSGGEPGAPGGSSSGSSSGASTGASMGSTSGSLSSAGGSSGGSGSPGSDGGPQSSRGCELGTSCPPGSDLAPPPAADGFQIVTPPGTYTIEPGQEIFPNYCVMVPGTTEFDVGRIESWMTPGSSHEVMVYRGGVVPAGSSQGCSLGAETMIFMASSSDQIVELKMPEGVGYALQPGAQLIVTMKFLNTGTSPLKPQVKLNFFRAASYRYEAAMMLSFNSQINVPSATAAGPGVQTVTGSCTAPAGSQFFAIGTHTNEHATIADVNFVSGKTTNVVHTTNWAYPDVGVWPAAPFLTVQSGDSLRYSCSYSNPGSSPITLGETELTNEMCMLVGYYFPAGNASCQ